MEMTIIKWNEGMLARCYEKLGYGYIQKSKTDVTKSSNKAVDKQSKPDIKTYSGEEQKVFKAFLNDNAQKLNNEQTEVKTDVKTKAMNWSDFEHAINTAMGKADENIDD